MSQHILKSVLIALSVFFLGAGVGVCNVSASEGVLIPFDTDRYIDTDQLQRGMTGYGMTVFKGTDIEKFDVVLVSVIRNHRPGQDAFLIRCKDPRFDLAKGVQGVSGSPVFFNGKLAGAMSFGWAFGEEPLYGCTSIRSMLQIQQIERPDTVDSSLASRGRFHFPAEIYTRLMRDNLLDSKQLSQLATSSHMATDKSGDSGSVIPLPMALTLNGVNRSTVRHLHQMIPDFNFQAGLPGGRADEQVSPAIKLQRGSAIVVPLITGDMDGAVMGTVTEVIGDQVYAFGHPWNSNGRVNWPMGTGYIHTIVSSKNMSFKLGTLIDIVGTLKADEGTAVFGRVGKVPTMSDITVHVNRPLISQRRQFKVQIARNERLTPNLIAMALSGTVLYRGDMPDESHLDYEVAMRFTDDSTLRFKNASTNSPLTEMIMDIMPAVGLVLNNPWHEIQLAEMDVNVTIHDKDITAQILSTRLNQRIFKPGEMLEGKVTLMTYRDPKVDVDFSLPIPGDMPEGVYAVHVGSYDDYRSQLARLQPHRFSAYKYEQLINILQERLRIHRKKLYVTMAIPRVSLAIEGEPLEALPASKAMMLTDKSRKIVTTKYQELNTRMVPMDYITTSNATFNIEVRR
ncbi:MAG: hypothetical protein K9M57_03475 [Phycisphaerae bacterium]|nr:hypothetical protein [Phycisphaerae bacterium]